MNHSPTIDRKRLERYPLATHPLLFVLFGLTVSGIFLFGHLVISPYLALAVEMELPGLGPRWLNEMRYARPGWALVIGVIHGVFEVVLIRFLQKQGQDQLVSTYFLSKTARSNQFRNLGLRKNLILTVGCIVTSVLTLVGVCALAGMSMYVAMGFSMGVLFFVMTPQKYTFHKKILRRRRIALAWEGIDPPDNRLAVRQKVNAGLFLAIFFGCMSACGYLAYILETHPIFAESKIVALYDAGSQLSSGEAAELERQLKESPTDHEARLKLIVFYSEQFLDALTEKDTKRKADVMQRQLPHARYFIEHSPGHSYSEYARIAMPFRTEDPDYAGISDLWREQVGQFPNDADVLWNAASFFRKLDDDYYEKLLERGSQLEPGEVRWSEALSELLLRRTAD